MGAVVLGLMLDGDMQAPALVVTQVFSGNVPAVMEISHRHEQEGMIPSCITIIFLLFGFVAATAHAYMHSTKCESMHMYSRDNSHHAHQVS